ncbi:MAG: polysaccharide deacetylase family protein [Candidatus Eisenbacteria bacterium]
MTGGAWKPVFFKGVNIGSAPPGHFPGEFAATKEQYVRWFEEAAELGANAVRVYTLHSPQFYQALHEHNTKFAGGQRKAGSSDDGRKVDSPGDESGAGSSGGRLWLFQGVWCELPEGLDLYDETFSAEFRAEIESVVSAVHGALSLPARRGHASGDYTVDVSEWLAGYILGREFEPYSILHTDEKHPEIKEHRGKFLSVKGGTPSECWVAGMCDFLVGFEDATFASQHAVSFTSWPTLDPMRHPTEAEAGGGRAYHDEDAVSLELVRVRVSERCRGGFFATFHAYPYYPDFINLDPGYGRFRDEHGFCNYAGYLEDLKRHLRGMPLLIGETGVPSSRGVAHYQPQGLNHGGASEAEQGVENCRLVEDCYRAGAAGVLLFELFDEWFKDNWLVMDFEIPRDRDVLWQNAEDPEEFFGLLAEEPLGTPESGFPDWEVVAPFYTDPEGDLLGAPEPSSGGARRSAANGAASGRSGEQRPCRDLRELRMTSDERFLYLRVRLSGGERDGARFSPDRLGLLIGLDVLDRERGDTRFPFVSNLSTEAGMEFVIYVEGRDSAAVLIDSDYNFSKFSRRVAKAGAAKAGGASAGGANAGGENTGDENTGGEDAGFVPVLSPFRSQANSDGQFSRMILETNRERIDAARHTYPPVHHDAGKLCYTEERESRGVSAGDWRFDADEGSVELRIPWALLNVTDPSSHMVLDDAPETPEKEATRTDGIIPAVVTMEPGRGGHICDAMPDPVVVSARDPAVVSGAGDRAMISASDTAALWGAGPDLKFNLPTLKVYTWDGWEAVEHVERRKASFDAVRKCFAELSNAPLPSARASVALWPDDCDAAVSVSFDDGTANQMEFALPVLEALGIRATFGLCGSWTGETRKLVGLSESFSREQMSFRDARKLRELGHEIASHGYRHVFLDTVSVRLLAGELLRARTALEEGLGGPVTILHYPFSRLNEKVKTEARRAGFRAARSVGGINGRLFDKFSLGSFAVVSDRMPSQRRFESLLDEARLARGWLILLYHNVLPSSSREAKCYRELSPAESYFVTPETFRRQMTELKRRRFYVAPEGDVLTYIGTRDNVSLRLTEEAGRVTVKVEPQNAEIDGKVVLTLVLELPWSKVEVEGSLDDSRYSLKDGTLTVRALACSELTVTKVE